MYLRFILFISLAGMGILIAQPDPGYTWIQANQTYIRMTVIEDGLYRVNPQQLSPFGYPGNIPVQQVKIFFRGQEQAIWVEDENSNGVFDGQDYAEFLGLRNDGGDDTELYIHPVTRVLDPNGQPNPHMSIFCDTAVYFFTWNTLQGKRLQNVFDTQYSLYTPAPFFTSRTLLNLHISNWFTGPSSGMYAENAEFVTGEGYYDLFPLLYGNTRSHTIRHPNAFSASGGQWQLEVRSFGYSIFSHVLELKLGNFPVCTGYSDSIRMATYTCSGDMSGLTGNQTVLNATAKYFPQDDNYLSWIRLTYDRNFQLNQADSVHILDPISLQPKRWRFTQMQIGPSDQGIAHDLNSGVRLLGTAGAQEMDMIVPASAQERHWYVTHSGAIKTPGISAAHIRNLHTLAGTPYIIITERSLATSAQQLASFRSSSLKNPQACTLVFTDEIYDEFGFGSVTPLAIRRFLKMAHANWSVKPQYVMLWGKGMSETIRRNTRVPFAENKVPTFGMPASDWRFVSGFYPSEDIAKPEMAIGRVNILNNTEGSDYIQKLIQYEQTPWDGTWMKSAVHLGGGENTGEQNAIRSYLEGRFQPVWQLAPLGGKVVYQQKSDQNTNTVTAQEIRDRISQGTALISFFGHSTSNIFDIEIREPEEYTNFGKYPLMIANGCYAGNFATVNRSFGERFMLAPGRGCIGYISMSGQGYITPLGELTTRVYETLFRDSLGKASGTSLMTAAQRFLSAGCAHPVVCQSTRNHIQQTNYQGDPALIPYFPTGPDYEINTSSIQFDPNPFAANDSFTVRVITRNLGLVQSDSLPLTLLRKPLTGTLQGEVIRLGTRNYPAPAYADTLIFPVADRDTRLAGLNTFTCILDSLQQLGDVNYLNNEASVNQMVPGNNPGILYPYDYAIVPDAQIRLSASALTMSQSQNLKYEFEIDTAYTFTSGFKQNSGAITGTACYAEWALPFALQEAQIYYWRVRLPDEVDGSWSYASFRYNNGKRGWSQADIPQYRNNPTIGLRPILPERRWAFDSLKADLQIITQSGGNARFNFNGIKVSNNDNQPVVVNGIWFSHIGGEALQIQTQDPLYGGWRWFPLPADISGLTTAIQQVPQGDYVVLCSQFNPGISSWAQNPGGEALYQAIEALGAASIRQVPDQNPYILLGRKGSAPGQAIEVVSPNQGSSFRLQTGIGSEGSSGSISSRLIGQALQWNQMQFSWQALNPEDSAIYALYAVNRNGSDSLIYSSTGAFSGVHAVSGLNAQLYPELRISTYASDRVQRTAPHIGLREVTFQPAMDVVADPARLFQFQTPVAQEGQMIEVQMAASNYTDRPADSLLVRYSVVLENKTIRTIGTIRAAPVPAGSFIPLQFTFSSEGMGGKNTLIIELNPDGDQNEIYVYNNFFYYPFTVMSDKVNPVLDVSFDGRRILDGEFVSPKPEIIISAKDNNPYFPMDSLGLFRVSYLTFAGQDSVVMLEGNPQIRFEPATTAQNKAKIEYRPGTLQDGEYTLKVQSQDRMGNLSGDEPYTIRFRVLNENTITPIFNYPNPFSTRTRFLFTLTGADIPVRFRIDVYTITGRMVRRLDIREYSDIHIGQNTSGFEWDGTDDYGDRLANGVYLYKAHISYADGTSPRIRDDGGMGRFFNNGFGKLVIMR